MEQGLRSNAIYHINKSQRWKRERDSMLKETRAWRCTDYFDSCWCYRKSCESGEGGEQEEEWSRIRQHRVFFSGNPEVQLNLNFEREKYRKTIQISILVRKECVASLQQWQLPYSTLVAEGPLYKWALFVGGFEEDLGFDSWADF